MKIAFATCRTLPDWEVDDLPLQRALEERGAAVVAASWDDAEVRWSDFDACLIRTTWDYMDRRAEYLDWADRVAGQTALFNPPEILRWNTHKSYLRQLEDLGVRMIPTVWIEPAQVPIVGEVMAERGWQRGFLKPVVGASSLGTLRFEANEEGCRQAQEHLRGHCRRAK